MYDNICTQYITYIMGGLSIILLFANNKNIEPGGIIQCDTTGAFYSYEFYDWRDAIHYIKWTYFNNVELSDKTFLKWSEIFGYDEDEEFNGDLNEFKYDNLVSTNIGMFKNINNVDLKIISAWTCKFDDELCFIQDNENGSNDESTYEEIKAKPKKIMKKNESSDEETKVKPKKVIKKKTIKKDESANESSNEETKVKSKKVIKKKVIKKDESDNESSDEDKYILDTQFNFFMHKN